MNVSGLPFAQQPWIVMVLFLLIFAGGVAIISYFKYRDWL
jgi:Mg2+ and Co2+ transporter CorA